MLGDVDAAQLVAIVKCGVLKLRRRRRSAPTQRCSCARTCCRDCAASASSRGLALPFFSTRDNLACGVVAVTKNTARTHTRAYDGSVKGVVLDRDLFLHCQRFVDRLLVLGEILGEAFKGVDHRTLDLLHLPPRKTQR